jgi:hypothetical protein
MDDVDEKNTGGKFRIIPIFEKAARMAAATKGIQVMMGSGVDRSTPDVSVCSRDELSLFSPEAFHFPDDLPFVG